MSYNIRNRRRFISHKVVVGLVCAVTVLAIATATYILLKNNQRHTPVVDTPKSVNTAEAFTSLNYTAKLLFMGDTMLARTIGDKILDGQNPYKNVAGTLATYDLRIANIETTIADPAFASRAGGKLYTFNAPVESVNTLKNAGVDVAILANNHTSDYGSDATANMLDNLHTARIATAGAGKDVEEAFEPLIIDITQPTSPKLTAKVAIIALNNIENNYTNAGVSSAGTAYFDKERIVAAIAKAKSKQADIIIVVPHWGTEYRLTATTEQIEWGHFFIDSGADIVIGGHPHVIQPTEDYKGKKIIYSIGNFIFDEMQEEEIKSLGQMIDIHINISAQVGDRGTVKTDTRQVALDAPFYIPTKLDKDGFASIVQ